MQDVILKAKFLERQPKNLSIHLQGCLKTLSAPWIPVQYSSDTLTFTYIVSDVACAALLETVTW